MTNYQKAIKVRKTCKLQKHCRLCPYYENCKSTNLFFLTPLDENIKDITKAIVVEKWNVK